MPKVDTTVRELVDMVKRGELRLPEMQRRYVWTAGRVRDLMDSLYRGYPSGTILVWETDHEPPARDLAVAQVRNVFMTQKMLLDGQQRLTSLCAVLGGEPVIVRNRKRPIEILFNLDHPEGPPQEFTEVEDDVAPTVINGEEESDEEVDAEETSNPQQKFAKRTFVVASKHLMNSPNWVRVSEVLSDKSDWDLLSPRGLHPSDARYQKYTARLQRLRKIKDYPYVMQVLERGLAYNEVAEIFVRVNSLGMKLRGSDLALAQITARWKNSLKQFEKFAEQFEEAWSVIDVGLLVRAMVIFATHQSRFKTVQNISLEQMQQAWIEAKRGIEFSLNFLQSNVAIEDGSLLSSPMVLLAVAAFGSAKNYRLSPDEEAGLRRWVLIGNTRGHLSRGSTETLLDQDLAIIFKDGSLESLFAQLNQQLGRLHSEPADFVGRGVQSPLFAAAYLAFKATGAKDWISGLALSMHHQGKMHDIEYHHIFPKSLLAHHGYDKSNINEIANMAFISGRANRKILNKEPKIYLPGIIADQGEQALAVHGIPLDPVLWELDAFPQFLEWRRKKLAVLVNELLGIQAAEGARQS
jgi:hypothetical protein